MLGLAMLQRQEYGKGIRELEKVCSFHLVFFFCSCYFYCNQLGDYASL